MIAGTYLLDPYHDRFTISENIKDEYEKLKFKDFKDKYLITEGDSYAINYKLDSDEKLTVAYFLYLHNYYTTFGCDSGVYSVDKEPIVITLEYDMIETDEGACFTNERMYKNGKLIKGKK